MMISRFSRAVVVVVMFAVMAAVPTGASAQTEEDVERAEDQLDRAQDEAGHALEAWEQSQEELEAALLALEEVTTQKESLIYTIGLLENKIEAYQIEVAELKVIVRDLVIEAYTSGGRTIVTTAASSSSCDVRPDGGRSPPARLRRPKRTWNAPRTSWIGRKTRQGTP